MSNSIAHYLEDTAHRVSVELEHRLPPLDQSPRRLHEAIRYAVFAGGKRLRPGLVRLGGEAHGAPWSLLAAPAAAIEMIHTYSLVHDDLPALDNDDLRRGRPTVHRAFDEATAVLVGDSLLTLGLTLLADAPAQATESTRRRAVSLVGAAIGPAGMIGGQVDDLEAERSWPQAPAAALESIHRRKTGALLTAALRLGALEAGVEPESSEDRRLAALGERIGLMFQIADDILDVEGTAESLGKTPGKDAGRRKLTYPALHGIDASRRRLTELMAETHELSAGMPRHGALLDVLVERLVTRRR